MWRQPTRSAAGVGAPLAVLLLEQRRLMLALAPSIALANHHLVARTWPLHDRAALTLEHEVLRALGVNNVTTAEPQRGAIRAIGTRLSPDRQPNRTFRCEQVGLGCATPQCR